VGKSGTLYPVGKSGTINIIIIYKKRPVNFKIGDNSPGWPTRL